MRVQYLIGCLFLFAGSSAAQQKACAILNASGNGSDTARIQAALDLCAPGRALVLRRSGQHSHFESGPLILPRGVTLFLDEGVTLDASRNPRDYDLAPGTCGMAPAAPCKPFVFSYQAAFSGVSGPGTIDGRGVAPELVSSYESQGFHIEGVMLRNASRTAAAIYKTTALVISDLKIDGEKGAGLLLSNTTGAEIAGLWIRAPGEALSMQSSILGPTFGIHLRDLHFFGEHGIATEGEVRNVTIDGKAMGMANLSAPAGGPPFSAAPKSTLRADVSDLPHPGTSRSLTVGAGGFATVQAAIDALPLSGGEIAVKPGTYREVVTIRKPHVHLHGTEDDPAKTVIVFNNGPKAGGTFATPTVFVEAPDVTIDHLSVVNDLGSGHGQGVALSVTADRFVARHLRILGAQDTLFATARYCYGDYGPCVAARQYFEDCYIEGNTDFIFGDAMAVFERCELHGIAEGSGVMYTAQSRHTESQHDSGYVFDHCRLTGAKPEGRGTISLGRPWRPYATVVYLHTDIEAPVLPAGWTEWPRFGKPSLLTAFYAEYDSTGPGANPQAREPYSHQLTTAEAEQWSPKTFLKGWTPWAEAK